VGLVGDDREVLAPQVGLGADQLQGVGEGLDGDDDDLRATLQRIGQLLRLRPAQSGDVCDDPWVRSIWRIASCNCVSRMLRSVIT
jgi:hypothetical protein